jgi:hypothetical protein
MTPAPPQPVVRDLPWIKQALQTAIELECSTLPLYLSALFSLKVQNYTVYNQIRSVVMEEMVHMAIAANLLAAIGGTPLIKTINTRFPTQGLPGGTEPDLRVGLAKLSRNQLRNFMRIESPEVLLRGMKRPEAYPTISVFYNGIRQAILDNADAIRAAVKAGGPSNQVYDDIGLVQILYVEDADPVKAMLGGIDEILAQGEGASATSLITPVDFELEESHYARFAELYYGATYAKPEWDIALAQETEHLFFKGQPIGWPAVINTLAVPCDGYAKILALDPNAAAVTKDLTAIDSAFSTTLTTLDAAWNGPAASSWKTVGLSVRGVGGNPPGMMDFRVLARENITRHQIPAEIVAQLLSLYFTEFEFLQKYTDLDQPVFYGPRFINAGVAPAPVPVSTPAPTPAA